MAPCGRFVEIGKRDILMDKRMGLGALKENVTFFSVHLDLLDQTHPHKVRALIDECTEMLANGKLKPTPTQVFPADQVVDAFKLMASGKHQGKIVVEIPKNFKPSTVDAQTGQPRLPQTLFPANGSVLVTGGTRGLGLEVGRWAADKGARHLILLTSSGDIPAKSTLVMEAIKATHPGITIDCVTCDVRDAAQVKKVFAEASPSITSVFHAANQYSAEDCTTLTDANLMGPTWDIKVQGAANIQKAAAETNSQISAMIMFTSLAGWPPPALSETGTVQGLHWHNLLEGKEGGEDSQASEDMGGHEVVRGQWAEGGRGCKAKAMVSGKRPASDRSTQATCQNPPMV